MAISILVTNIAQFAQGKDIQNTLGTRLNRPHGVAAISDVSQHPGPWMIVPAPLAEILDHQRVHVLKAVGAA
jgi:hypothetical protein